VGEDLGDVHERRALLSRRQQCREPAHAELGDAARDDLLRNDVGAAGPDGDVEVLGGVEALRARRVVTGELRLGDPLELEVYRSRA